MAESRGAVFWRQGDIFTYRSPEGNSFNGIIASHDCDICAADMEPHIEAMSLEHREEADGNLTLGKNVRRLHCAPLLPDGSREVIEISMHSKRAIAKEDFFANATKEPHELDATEIGVFRRWLASRYSRPAFPDAFEALLSQKLREKIDKLSKRDGTCIQGIYFNLDEGRMVERTPDDLYQLAIWVAYDPSRLQDEDLPDRFASRLEQIFTGEFFVEKNDSWSGIQLTGCSAISIRQFPVALANGMKSWRVDHRSHTGEDNAGLPGVHS